jgi:glycosyltransferase involved in cell wall biosynthesis
MKSALPLTPPVSDVSSLPADASAIGMYLVLPVPFRLIDGKLQIEAQAANGLDRWADHFAVVTVAAPLIPDSEADKLVGFVWRAADSLEHANRVICQPLPWAYSLRAFAQAWKRTRSEMAVSIKAAQYLQFAISGLAGDWAAVGAVEAHRQHRRYSIHTDRVEHELIKKVSSAQKGLRRFKTRLEVGLMKLWHKHVIKHASLGLWHGEDCYRAYSPWCGENHVIHDIHTKESDRIDDIELAQKLASVKTDRALRICYAGRLDPMKAPLEWLRAVAAAREMGARVTATWFGEGPMLQEAKAEMLRLDLESIVAYPGFVAGRAELLREIRSSDVMLFTHVTPESPRNLLESLVSGTPIVGYDIPYASDLIAREGGGMLVPMHDHRALGAAIAELDRDRERLANLINEAARNGQRFTDAAVFAERSELIRRFA